MIRKSGKSMTKWMSYETLTKQVVKYRTIKRRCIANQRYTSESVGYLKMDYLIHPARKKKNLRLNFINVSLVKLFKWGRVCTSNSVVSSWYRIVRNDSESHVYKQGTDWRSSNHPQARTLTRPAEMVFLTLTDKALMPWCIYKKR